MNFLDNTTFQTSIILTDYAKANNKTVKDIVKFSILDDDIDYNLQNANIKELVFMTDINNYDPKYLFYNMTDIVDMNFNIVPTNGTFILNSSDLNVRGTKTIVFTCTNITGIYLAIYDINFISSLRIDNGDNIINNNIINTHFYIKNTVEIVFSNSVNSGKISFFDISSDLVKDFNILFA